jgi:type IV secretory pathway VirB9-like protein
VKIINALLLEAAVSAHAEEPAAATPSPYPSPVTEASSKIGGENPTLNTQQAAGVGITRQWEDKSYEAMVLVPGQDGSIQFHYGQSLPTIVCAILQVTDVELQPGEIVNEVKLGDTERWAVEPAVSGDATKTEHLIIKPKDIGLQTSLVVTTDRRTYHVELLSDAKEFMHHVSFVYQASPAAVAVAEASRKSGKETADKPPETRDVKVSYEDASSPSRRARRQASGKEAGSDAKDDDGYQIAGKAPWRPLSAYNDGKKTYLEMPKGMSQSEAPALFLLKKSGLFGWGSQKTLVNFRVHGKWYVADTVIDRGVLVTGVGSGQTKVTITRSTPKDEQ